jgi:integrase
MQRQRQGKTDVDPITDAELAILVPRITGEYRPFFELLLCTGIRTSEALALRNRDLWVGGSGLYKNETQLGTVGIAVKRLKKDGANKDPTLIEIMEKQALWGQLNALGRKRRATLFNFSRVAAWKALRRFCAAAGVRPLSPHQFRHTYARRFAQQTHYDSAGRPLSQLDHMILLGKALGHASERWVSVYFQPHPSEIGGIIGQVGASFKSW